MFKKMALLVGIMIMLSAVTMFADTGCKPYKIAGSYTRVDAQTDVFGDGSVIHQYIYHLKLNSDGTASQLWTGGTDYLINTGITGPFIGSWVCRADDKLVVTLLTASYNSTPPGTGHPLPDVSLGLYQRLTYLFAVTDDNTLTRIQARGRNYGPTDDPTNPATGTLGTLSTRVVTYKRLIASDADLLLP